MPWNAFNTFGEFGDFVGGVANPLLALLAFLALLLTIRLQLKELSLSREELTLSRDELKRSASALEKQNSNLERQRLSQAFFDLFDMYKSVVAEMSAGSKENREIGKAALKKNLQPFLPYSFYSTEDWSIDKIRQVHADQNDELGNYFRIIYRILSYLHDNQPEGEFFADMFRAQLTTPELHLLFLNCVSDVGKPMEKYACAFQLFDNMPLPSGHNFREIAMNVDPKSFGKNTALLELASE